MSADFIESSKLSWTPTTATISDTQLAVGCLQRIAVAMESLNRNWCNVIRENVNYRESIASLRTSNEAQNRKIRRLKSHLKKAGLE